MLDLAKRLNLCMLFLIIIFLNQHDERKDKTQISMLYWPLLLATSNIHFKDLLSLFEVLEFTFHFMDKKNVWCP